MQASKPHLSSEDMMNLWKSDPLFDEYKKIEKDGQESAKKLNFESEAYKTFADWNPIVKKSNNKDVSDVQKRLHATITKDYRSSRIDDVSVDIFKETFIWSTKRGRELPSVKHVGDFITFHRNGFPLNFKPSIEEVLGQLPPHIIESQDDFVVTTETIADDFNQCTIGSNRQYHVAITKVYTVGKKTIN